MLLANEPDIKIVGQARDGREAVQLAAEFQPDIVLMDIRMPGMDGVEATRRITADGFCLSEGRTIQVIVLTTYNINEYVCRAIVAGASGFLLKDSMPQVLAAALRAVAAGDCWLTPEATACVFQLVSASHGKPSRAWRRGRSHAVEGLDSLTERERQVLALIGRGLSNKEIVGHLFISETTVKTHVYRIFHKLGIRDRQQAVVKAYESGLVS
jgi:DNA-binding NarL/FixJ family response regulator